jgi:hypothetical protein
MASAFKTWSLLLALFLASCALAQESARELRGTWMATAGSETFRGSWGAETFSRSPDAAQGYWTLLNDSGERVLQGTWSARKVDSRWHGTWMARTAQGRTFSGSWDAEMTESKGKTFRGHAEGDARKRKLWLLAKRAATAVIGGWKAEIGSPPVANGRGAPTENSPFFSVAIRHRIHRTSRLPGGPAFRVLLGSDPFIRILCQKPLHLLHFGVFSVLGCAVKMAN